jgi:hypothetical protein
MSQREVLVMRDIADGQLETADGKRVSRVADVLAEWREDGTLVLTHLLVGPEALAGRVSSRLRRPFHRLLRGRFEHRISIGDVAEIGLNLKLRRRASEYAHARADTWVADHVIRFIPGSGR